MTIPVIYPASKAERGGRVPSSFTSTPVDTTTLMESLDEVLAGFAKSEMFANGVDSKVHIKEVSIHLGVNTEGKFGLLGIGATAGIDASVTITLSPAKRGGEDEAQ